MSAAVLTPRVTVHQFERREQRTDGCFEELIEGEIFVSPNVKPQHNYVASRVTISLLALENQGFIVLGEVACRVSDESLPNTDVCVISVDRWNAIPDGEFLKGAPELVVEVNRRATAAASCAANLRFTSKAVPNKSGSFSRTPATSLCKPPRGMTAS